MVVAILVEMTILFFMVVWTVKRSATCFILQFAQALLFQTVIPAIRGSLLTRSFIGEKNASKILEIMFSHGRWMMILQGLGTTLLIALCAVLMGTILGCIFAIFKLSNSKILNAISNVYTTLIRGIPMATQLMICYFVIFSPLGVRNTVLVAIISFGVNSGAYCTEIFRAGINGVDKGQMEAGRSLGLNWAQTMFAIIIPQAFKTILPTFASEFITLIKETSVASFIAVVDLQKACDNIRNATYNAWVPLLSCALVYLILTVGLTKIFSAIETKVAKSEKK